MGTFNSDAFSDKVGADGDRDILFNGPGDGGDHGHVVIGADGSYKYARDVEGNEYDVQGKNA